MKKDILKLIRPSIKDLDPYSSARNEFSGTATVFLDANENPFNAPYNRYPDPQQQDLKKRIAEIKSTATENIFVGNGSDEAIDLLFRIFCEPDKDNVVSIAPSYGMYKVCADINNVEFRMVLLNEDYSLDFEALKNACDENTKLLFLCSPNNPTANSMNREEMLKLASDLDLILVVDEAYIDFSTQESLIKELKYFPNLVILQTFSKAWGLAAIRLGIALADPLVIGYLNRVKYPYNLNKLTQDFALKTLENENQKDEWVKEILANRKSMIRSLSYYRFVKEVYPSDANFILVKVDKALKVYTYLMEKGIIVRDRSRVELCEGSLRITIGTREENQALLDALMQYQRDFVESCQI